VRDYERFLAGKVRTVPPVGFVPLTELNPLLFDWQAAIVTWAVKRGRACLFADCGLGKTFMQLEWARLVAEYTLGKVLILSPLAVSQQTLREAERFGVTCDVGVSRDGSMDHAVTITNYELFHRFDVSACSGVVLDESSILKNYTGKIRTSIIDGFADTPYRLACTATPAPNDHMELANHSEFIGAMSRAEMLATFFCHDGGNTSQWRLKGHAVETFWRWVASWAVTMRKPSDAGFSDDGFALPQLNIIDHEIPTDMPPVDGELFAQPAQSLNEQRRARRATLTDRVSNVAELVNASSEPWVVWCELNDESTALAASIPGAFEVTGSMDSATKEARLEGFSSGLYRVIVTKPSIGGFGLNWQHCARMAFVGLSHSFEQFYQATRRCWRFGQKRDVEAHIAVTDLERAVAKNVRRKQADHETMANEMVGYMADSLKEQLHGVTRNVDIYMTEKAEGDGWTLHLGDCVDVASGMESESVDYSVFSPPFASLYTYSASPRDMGNCGERETFMEHVAFLVGELFRVTKPGRLCSFHCMQLPSTKEFDGEIGLKDFRGWMVEAFSRAGWIFHSEVCIWKDPVTAMQRTKAIGLLWKQLRKDSTISRQGIPDYVVTMRKPGVNAEPVSHTMEDYPVDRWQRIASPVWMDINPSDTLQRESARADKDERHIAPLQLEVIRRCVELWTNEGDLVFSPFAGIGSEGFVALREGRRFVGAELKASYFEQARRNLSIATAQMELEL